MGFNSIKQIRFYGIVYFPEINQKEQFLMIFNEYYTQITPINEIRVS